MSATTRQTAKALRVAHSIPSSEPDIATLSYGLSAADGTLLIDATKLQEGDATHLAEVQTLLGGGGQFGNYSTIPAEANVTLDENSQSVVFGAFTVYGTVTIEGELRVGDWLF